MYMAEKIDKKAAIKARRAEQKLAAEKAEKSRKIKKIVITLCAIVALTVPIAGTIGVSVSNNAKVKAENEAKIKNSVQLQPENIDTNGAYHINSAGGVIVKGSNEKSSVEAVRLDMFFDPQCPGCGAVDRSIGEQLNKQIANNEIDLYMSPVSFLDQASTDDYSTRSVNAIITVAEKSPQNFMKFVNKLYEDGVQPGEGAQYIPVSDDMLATLAKESGVSAEVADTIPNRQYVNWIKSNSEKQIDRKDFFPENFSTPALFFNAMYKDGKAVNYSKVLFGNNDIVTDFNNAFNSAVESKGAKIE